MGDMGAHGGTWGTWGGWGLAHCRGAVSLLPLLLQGWAFSHWHLVIGKLSVVAALSESGKGPGSSWVLTSGSSACSRTRV